MAKRDYYDILGVDKSASQDDVRKAYLKLAHKYHPDKTGGDKAAEEKLKEINAAYDTLKNPQKRQQYDAYGGTEGMGGMGGGGFGGGFGGFSAGGQGGFDAPFDDFFDVLFGRSGASGGQRTGRRRGSRPGSDLEYRLSISLREAATGAKRTIQFKRYEQCGDCNGTGAAKGSQPATCADCQGTGQVRRAQGFFSITQTCPRCKGQGRIILDPCKACSGAGRIALDRKIKVDLPAGISSGQRVRYQGEGEAGEGNGPRGDLYVLVEVEEDEIFTRDGNDVICEIPISFPQAILGDKIRVPTLSGEAELRK